MNNEMLYNQYTQQTVSCYSTSHNDHSDLHSDAHVDNSNRDSHSDNHQDKCNE